MTRRNSLRPPFLMKTELQKEGSAHKCEGPPRTDKQWKIQTLKLLDKRVGMELSKVLGVPVFVLSYKEVKPDQAFF